MADTAVRLPLRADDMPEITDAGVGLTLLMIAGLMAERERQALHLQLAAAFEARDLDAAAALHRRLAGLPPAAARMADVARAGIDRFDSGRADPESDPAANARARRSLVKAANWLDRRFWPMYGTVRPVMPPASDAPAPAARRTAPAPTSTAPSPSCGDIMRERLGRFDRELAAMADDTRPSTLTARRIMTADRNAQAATCRDCDGCPVSNDPITAPLPLL